MNFDEYILERRRLFALQPEPKAPKNLLYASVALGGEAGELQNIVKKTFRDNNGNLTSLDRWKIIDELGDIMWECDFICQIIDVDTSVIFHRNINKLKERYHLA